MSLYQARWGEGAVLGRQLDRQLDTRLRCRLRWRLHQRPLGRHHLRSLRFWEVDRLIGRGEPKGKGIPMLPDDQQLLTDEQLRDASDQQLQDLIARLDLLLRTKGQPGLTTRSPEEPPHAPETSDPADPADPSAGG